MILKLDEEKVAASVPSPSKKKPSTFDRIGWTTKWIPIRNLAVLFPSAQRAVFDEAHAQHIAATFDDNKFGIITVMLPNEKGIYHVIDGWHRCSAVRSLWDENQMVPCRVVNASDSATAAELFLELNSNKPITPVDRFKIAVEAGRPDELAAFKIVRAAGYKIRHGGGNGVIQAVGALMAVYTKHHGPVLKLTLEVIQATWGMDENSVVAPILRGYGAFLAEYDRANMGRLTKNVQTRYTPGQLIGAARSIKETQRGQMVESVVQVLLSAHNRGTTTGRLKPKT